MSPEEQTVRQIFELANRGLFGEVLRHYHPGAELDLGGGDVAGSPTGKGRIDDLIEVAIKEYGRPRVRIDELQTLGSRVYVETRVTIARSSGQPVNLNELHIFEFSDGKVESHRVFTNSVSPARLQNGEQEGLIPTVGVPGSDS